MGGVPGYPWLHSESWSTYDSQNKIIEKKKNAGYKVTESGCEGWRKAPAAKPDHLNSIPGTHMVEEQNRLPQVVPTSTHTKIK